MPETSLVHRALRSTCAGDTFRIVADGRWMHIETLLGVPIAALSEAGRDEWLPRLPFVRTATVTAMVHRTIEQEAEPYRAKALVPAWEYPVIEVCWSSPLPS